MRILLSVLVTLFFISHSNAQTSFTAADTVCVGEPVTISNTSIGTSSHYWNFCVADINTAPSGVNLGNIGNQLSSPVFIDYAFYNNNYYGFLVNYEPGALIRLNFGNSLLNTPTATNMGNFNAMLLPGAGSEGIQVVFNEGKWYAIVLTGFPTPGNLNRVIKIDFGADLTNPTPNATNWGNVGNLLQPIDLHVFKEGNEWFGFTVSAENNSITRFNFTNSFDNTPTAINLGNIGNLSYPTGIYAISDNGNWSVFVLNAGDRTRSNGPFSLTRLDFGSSLLNIPVGVNLGNPGNVLQHPRDLTIMKFCGEFVGFAVNGHLNNRDIVRMNFKGNLLSTPTLTTMGNIGNLSFPHSISKLFRIENDVYSFITNVDTKTITRLRFTGCANNIIPASNVRNPSPVVYNTPGTYNINLTTDDGLPSQSAFCKNIVVVPKLVHAPLKTLSICHGDSVLLSSNTDTRNRWNNGAISKSIYVRTAGVYWVESSNGACKNVDSFNVSFKGNPFDVNLGNDTSICSSDTLLLNASNAGAVYTWQNGSKQQQLAVTSAGKYYVAVNKDGCIKSDTIAISSLPAPLLGVSADTIICHSGEAVLTASGGIIYNWSPASLVDKFDQPVTTARPTSDTKFFVTTVGANACKSTDSIIVTVKPKPEFDITSSMPVVCLGDSVQLTASGGDDYLWTPQTGIRNPTSNVINTSPTSATRYKVVITNRACKVTDSVFIQLPIVAKPQYIISKSNDIDCNVRTAKLVATGGSFYSWTPVTGLSDPNSGSPEVSISRSTMFHVKIKAANGCEVEDSILVSVTTGTIGNTFNVPNSFSPNNDGYNDCFSLKKWGTVSKFSMLIYNRWGQLIFESNNSTLCWNGKLNGSDCPIGGYVYIINAETPCGIVSRKGMLMLIR